MEWRVAPIQLKARDLNVIQSLGEEDVESAPSVDQHLVEFDSPDDSTRAISPGEGCNPGGLIGQR